MPNLKINLFTDILLLKKKKIYKHVSVVAAKRQVFGVSYNCADCLFPRARVYSISKENLTADVIKEEIIKRTEGELKDVLCYINDKCVSSDFIGCQYSGVVDFNQIRVVDKLITVGIWFDSEMGYSCRVLDLVKHMIKVDNMWTHFNYLFTEYNFIDNKYVYFHVIHSITFKVKKQNIISVLDTSSGCLIHFI